MIDLKKTTAAILSGALALSLASCSNNQDKSDTSKKETYPSVSVEVPPPKDSSFGLAGLAAVKYSDYALSGDDDIKTLENKIETKYGVDIIYGDDVRTEFSDESEKLTVEKHTNEENIKKALTTLDGILKLYPKTFFYQLRFSEDSPVKIYLTGGIESLTYPEASINAFTSDTDSKGEVYLVVDIAGQDGIFNPPTLCMR